jgi:hypothetical protein
MLPFACIHWRSRRDPSHGILFYLVGEQVVCSFDILAGEFLDLGGV